MLGELELVIDAKATLGEGPCWDYKKQLLYWVDILEKKVHSYNPITNENKIIFLEQMVGSVVPSESGNVVLALENAFHWLDPDMEEILKAIYKTIALMMGSVIQQVVFGQVLQTQLV